MNSRVLLVEDDDVARAALSMTLKMAGYVLIEAVSVKTALMHLDVLDLSCVVLDLKLPNGHGRRVVEELQAKRNDVPVVILSGHHYEETWDFPVVRVLDKPAPKAVLLEAVGKAVGYAEAIRSLRNTTRRLREVTGVR